VLGVDSGPVKGRYKDWDNEVELIVGLCQSGQGQEDGQVGPGRAEMPTSFN
jgi:hypothetical protein